MHPAVIVRRAVKRYGRDSQPVLKYLDMTVDTGVIYGLLGPSGCGKTTLLSCIVGRRRLDAGEMWVLGMRPEETGVLGRRVGYMPQDIALVAEFTVRDAVYYFGRIYAMKSQKLKERFEFLSDLLELPAGGKLVKHLSGGQQRRVSLAAALVHEPELLILDEPTVGLDPVLRERIWEFLAELARGGTTVIITTHYIDETKQAHKIGLLRNGQLLAEDSPEEILRKFDCNTLEDAFLKLSMRQHELVPVRHTLSSSPDVIPEMANTDHSRYSSKDQFDVCASSTDVLTKKESSKESRNLSRARYKAVFIKSLQQFGRHPGGLIFSLLFPIIQAVAFFAAVGHEPRDLRLAVVNEEAALSPYGLDICHNKSIQHVTQMEDYTCEFFMLSCWFLETLEQNNLYQAPYTTIEEAIDSVKSGHLYGALYIPHNYSSATATRLRFGQDIDNETLEESNIAAYLDMTNHQVSHYVKSQLYKTYEKFTKRVMRACKLPEDMIQLPVQFETPIYGSVNAQYVAYMAPGIMITIIFFLSAIVTSTLLISDRLEGVWERSVVAGVRSHELLNVHIFIHSSVILFQTLEMMCLAFLGYGLPHRGPMFVIGLLLFLQGLSGMCYGFLLSVCCSSYTLSFFIATGSFYPMILLCGILWPLEGMSKGLQIIAMTLPFTVPTRALRHVLEKGSTITDPAVYSGILVTSTWLFGTLLLCYVVLKCRARHT